jgi:ABC-type molybdate transport system substrate-binding protein
MVVSSSSGEAVVQVEEVESCDVILSSSHISFHKETSV